MDYIYNRMINNLKEKINEANPTMPPLTVPALEEAFKSTMENLSDDPEDDRMFLYKTLDRVAPKHTQ